MVEANQNIRPDKKEKRGKPPFNLNGLKNMFDGWIAHRVEQQKSRELPWKSGSGSHSIEKPESIPRNAQEAQWNKEMRPNGNQDNKEVIEIPGLGTLALVADGVGGTRGGADRASVIARDTIRSQAQEILSKPTDELKREELIKAIKQAHSNIVKFLFEQAKGDKYDYGAATTISVAIVYTGADGRPKVMTANVGDSPIILYKPRGGRAISLFTSDNEKIRKNDPTAPNNTYCLGLSQIPNYPNMELAYGVHVSDPHDIDSKGGEVLILATDGVTSSIDMRKIDQNLLNQPADVIAQNLVQAAHYNMGRNGINRYGVTPDDATAVALTFSPNEKYRPKKKEKQVSPEQTQEAKFFDRVALQNDDTGAIEYNWFLVSDRLDGQGKTKYDLKQVNIVDKKPTTTAFKTVDTLEKVDTELYIKSCTNFNEIKYALESFKCLYDKKTGQMYSHSLLQGLISLYENNPTKDNLDRIPDVAGLRQVVGKILRPKRSWGKK